MSYQVIARKYRPQRFSDVVGQEHVTQTLSNAIQQNRIAHAYLFVGPRGTGKTTTARIFAKALNCTGGPKIDFPDDDPRVMEITEGRSLDVLEIDGASNRGIEEIRELRDTVRYAPASSKFKIYIIDEVHMLTKEAFNALLKTLEEPPAHVKFMFATTEPEKVLPTILSRCQRFDLRRISTALIVKHLAYIAGQEQVKIEPAALHAIARGADGGMRDAESTLDQLISFCGNEIVEADVLSMFGLTSQAQILTLVKATLGGDAATALRELNSLAKQGKDLNRLLSELLGHFRNLLIFHVSKGDLSLVEVSEAEAASLAEQAQTTTPEILTRIMEVLSEGEGRFRDAASKKIFVEVTLLKAIQARGAVSIDVVLKQLQQLRTESGGGTSPSGPAPAPAAAASVAAPALPRTPPASPVSAPAQAPVVAAAPIPAPAAARPPSAPPTETTPVIPPAPGSEDLAQTWSRLLEAVGKVSAFTRSYLLQGHPVSFQKNLLIIGFGDDHSDTLAMVDSPKTQALLQGRLVEMGYANAQAKFIKAEASSLWTPPVQAPTPTPVSETPPWETAPAAPVAPAFTPMPGAAKAREQAPAAATAAPAPTPVAASARSKPEPIPFNKDDFKNDPLIQKALEIFKGHIVEVRA